MLVDRRPREEFNEELVEVMLRRSNGELEIVDIFRVTGRSIGGEATASSPQREGVPPPRPTAVRIGGRWPTKIELSWNPVRGRAALTGGHGPRAVIEACSV
eukprot:CAMPEP_0115836268 /NCGR_PEP_ID=MMETSP0287-20121206/4621_1 /TAXON_ID=412157 /ORGANISM="Chrysochromulina rotalis, Strain UIO044" /LENGTH=100 /DNA_ID=CAMNT_0003289749 /DNA_START=564 /DNA_END=866 /DNA_ORIENTATION=+